MPSYDELDNEVWWRQEFEPPNLRKLTDALRAFYKVGPSLIGARGDNNHTSGYHRSRNWILNSRFCTNRTYSVSRTAGDRSGGDGNWFCAVDITLPTAVLIPMCQRLDAAVRAEKLEKVTEWYGNRDGDSRVDGFDNIANRVASSDSSHLWHLHISFDRGRANEDHSDLLAILTGGPLMALTDKEQEDLYRRVCNLDAWMHQGLSGGAPAVSGVKYGFGRGDEQPPIPFALNATLAKLATAGVDPAELAAALAPYLPKPPTAAEIAKAVLAEQVRELTD